MTRWVGLIWIAVLSGCFGSHGMPRASGDRDTGAMVVGDAAVGVDSATTLDASPRPTTVSGPSGPSLCEAFAAGDPVEGLPCDPGDFEECTEPVAGVPCCQTHTQCGEDGRVFVAGLCTDDCDQRCGAVSEAASCTRFVGCEWLAETCDVPPSADLIAGPRCIGADARPCEDSDDCRRGELCQRFWVDLCASSDCRACGGTEQRFCASDL